MIQRILLALSLVFLWGGTMSAQTTLLLKPELTGLISSEVSGKIAFENIRDLSVFPRWYGSDGMEGAARWIMKRAERYGLGGIRLEEFPVDKETYYFMQKPWLAWNCQAGELRMVQPVPELVTSFLGFMVPVTESPYLSSLSSTLWPPTSSTPASLILSSPPLRISLRTAISRVFTGKQTMFIAVSGFPPIAHISLIELAAAICPKVKGSSTTGVMKSTV